jgi:Tfp pilus assembly protein PilX
MIIAWVLSIIAIMTSLVINLEHSTALQIRLLAIEQEAHIAFVAAEKQLDQCEAQLSTATSLAVLNAHDASAACDITVVDANAIGELIRIRALGNAVPKNPTPTESNQTKQFQLESMVYRDKRDHTLKRLSWRVLWSATQSIRLQLT